MTPPIFLPTKGKIILFIGLLIVTVFIPKYECFKGMMEGPCSNQKVNGIGYPPFYGEAFIGDTLDTQFSTSFFILNLLIYYLLSCLILFFLTPQLKKFK